jgi:CheY-like chemotaxis protein
MTPPGADRPTPDILLCEDDDAHAHLIRRALFADRRPCNLIRCRDGEQTLDYLRRHAPFEEAPRPDLVLLDLKLPRKGGLEVLEELKSDPLLRAIPVVVLSTSNARRDRLRAAHLHANGYVVKPLDFDEFERAIGALRAFWCEVHEPAPEPGSAALERRTSGSPIAGQVHAHESRAVEAKPSGVLLDDQPTSDEGR